MRACLFFFSCCSWLAACCRLVLAWCWCLQWAEFFLLLAAVIARCFFNAVGIFYLLRLRFFHHTEAWALMLCIVCMALLAAALICCANAAICSPLPGLAVAACGSAACAAASFCCSCAIVLLPCCIGACAASAALCSSSCCCAAAASATSASFSLTGSYPRLLLCASAGFSAPLRFRRGTHAWQLGHGHQLSPFS